MVPKQYLLKTYLNSKIDWDKKCSSVILILLLGWTLYAPMYHVSKSTQSVGKDVLIFELMFSTTRMTR
jgi:hypothetical protein